MATKRELLGEFKREAEVTRKILERVPADRFDWTPHEKSWTFRQMSSHVANLMYWLAGVLTQTGVDLEGDQPESFLAADPKQLLERFDTLVDEAGSLLASCDAATLDQTWTLRSGEHIIFELPRSAALRFFVFNHLIHHRGQLTVYLRLCDISVPAVYGPSADEQG